MPASPVMWQPTDSKLDWERFRSGEQLGQTAARVPFLQLALERQREGRMARDAEASRAIEWQRLYDQQTGLQEGIAQGKRQAVTDLIKNVVPVLDPASKEKVARKLGPMLEQYGMEAVDGLHFGATPEEQARKFAEEQFEFGKGITERETAVKEEGMEIRAADSISADMARAEQLDLNKAKQDVDKWYKEQQVNLAKAGLRLDEEKLQHNIDKLTQGDKGAAFDIIQEYHKVEIARSKDSTIKPMSEMLYMMAVAVLLGDKAPDAGGAGRTGLPEGAATAFLGKTSEDIILEGK